MCLLEAAVFLDAEAFLVLFRVTLSMIDFDFDFVTF
jgi:hypothetical protein